MAEYTGDGAENVVTVRRMHEIISNYCEPRLKTLESVIFSGEFTTPLADSEGHILLDSEGNAIITTWHV